MTSYERFWRAVTHEGRARCVMANRPEHTCDGPLDAHHVIPKNRIKGCYALPRYARELALVDDRNGAPVCRAGHHEVTVRATRLRPDEVPGTVYAFATDYALQWALEMELEPVAA